MYTRLATRPGLFALSQRLAGLGASLVSPRSTWMKLPAVTGWGYSKDFPRPATKPFRTRFGSTTEAIIVNNGGENPVASVDDKTLQSDSISETSRINLVGRFTEELLALGGRVVICKEADIHDKVMALLRSRNIDRVQTWDQVPGLEEVRLTEAGISVRHEEDENIKVGITGALGGIAETGTLVIPGGQGQPLSASLLPEIHIAVLRTSDIEESLEKVLSPSASLKTGLQNIDRYPAVVLVSGPSRTADIEMTLTIGVHGPGELHVFVLV
jgi:L-lactate dehydrogenase complex protein LldG